jgi:serine/threonine-protein kinase
MIGSLEEDLTMSQERKCPDCGATLPADAPRGLCPNCLMGAALSRTSPQRAAATGTFEPAGPTVLDTIAQSIGPVPRLLLRDTAPGETPGPIVLPDTRDADPTIRYRIDGEIARGGMGAILKGRDPGIGRDVAIKVLRADLRENGDLVRRFVEEAQIGGQLQHPGVVPIYDLGTFADRRPFFSMKLVKGQTLADLLAVRSGPADDLPRFLSIYAAIAQTMAYSHTRGVIHRDLKPSNVMVGSFGEVQVMDWGLARVMARGGVVADGKAANEPIAETLITTARGDSDRDLSRAGSVMGTPGYMPPEQAGGQTNRIDERADVFALGSILCEILTGSPAFRGRTATEILRKSAGGDTADALARLDVCGAEAELVALARDCLAVEPDGRPRDANVVAERITSYLAGVQERVQAAERERAVAVARAIEERRRRKLQVGLAASLLALTTAGGLGTTYYLQQRQARAAAVDQVLTRASLLRDQAREHADDPARWGIALAAIDQAESALGGEALAQGRLGALRDEVQDGARAADRDRRLLDRLSDIRSARVDDWDGYATDADYADAFRAAGLDIVSLPPAAAAARIKGRPPAVATALVSALDDWAAVRRGRRGDKAGARRLSEIAGGADPDPWRTGLRTALNQPDRADRLTALKGLFREAKFDELGPVSLDLLGSNLDAAGDPAAGEAVLRAAQRRHPDDVWVNSHLAYVLEELGRMDEAVRYHTAARSIRPEMAHHLAHALEAKGESDEGIEVFRQLCLIRARNGRHLSCLGQALQRRGQSEEAGKVLEAAITALRGEIQLHPDYHTAHLNLGNALKAQGKHDEAIASYRTAVRLMPDDATPHRNLGTALQAQRKYDEAIAEYRTATRRSPDDIWAHVGLGSALEAQGKYDEAVTEFRTAIRLKPNEALAHCNLGLALHKQGKDDEAIAECRTSIRLKPDDATAHLHLGLALVAKGKYDEAIAEYRTAIKLSPSGYDGYLAHFDLGLPLQAQGKLDEAITEFRAAIHIKPDGAEGHYALASALAEQGKVDEALAESRAAIKLDPDDPQGHDVLGDILREHVHDYPAAEAAFRQAIRLKSDNPRRHLWLGHSLKAQGKHDEAISEYRTAIKLKPDFAVAHNNLGAILCDQVLDYRAAEAAFRQAIRFDPDDDSARRNLGHALRHQGKVEEAIAEYRTAIKLKPDYAETHVTLGALLCDRVHAYPAAEAAFRQAIRLKPDHAIAHMNLGNALQAQGRLEETIAEFRTAIKLNPDIRTASWRARVETMAAMVNRLPAIVRGDDKPTDATEGFAAGELCYIKGLHAAGARLYGEALALDPKGAGDRQATPRYGAACCAALAGSGQSKDVPPPDEAARRQLRDQARDWLTSELADWTKFLETQGPKVRPVVVKSLQWWKIDPDLAGIRDDKAIRALPDVEQKACRALWAEVEALMAKTLAGTVPRQER